MTVSAAEFLKGTYNATKAMGEKAINSDSTLVIDGQEDLMLLTKQFPWPTLSTGGEIEVPTPLGAMLYQPQQIKIAQQGQMALMETVRGRVQTFLETVVQQAAYFQATIYEGTPERFYRAFKLRDCFWQAENPDRDWENRAQITLINGTLFFHFFSERIPGNIPV